MKQATLMALACLLVTSDSFAWAQDTPSIDEVKA